MEDCVMIGSEGHGFKSISLTSSFLNNQYIVLLSLAERSPNLESWIWDTLNPGPCAILTPTYVVTLIIAFNFGAITQLLSNYSVTQQLLG